MVQEVGMGEVGMVGRRVGVVEQVGVVWSLGVSMGGGRGPERGFGRRDRAGGRGRRAGVGVVKEVGGRAWPGGGGVAEEVGVAGVGVGKGT